MKRETKILQALRLQFSGDYYSPQQNSIDFASLFYIKLRDKRGL
jgi:hypothetical protein